jgi:bacterial/archaeal transporter family-2 protein
MGTYLTIAIGLGVGVLVVIQGAMNARLSAVIGSVLPTTLVNFSVGALVMLAASLVWGEFLSVARVVEAPRWSLIGGAMGACLVMGIAFLIPRIGAAYVVALIAGGQTLAALLFDHFGWLGVPQISVSLHRLVGALLVILGTILFGYR